MSTRHIANGLCCLVVAFVASTRTKTKIRKHMSVSFQATRFAGGSQSEEFDSSNRGGIFQKEVKAAYPSCKKTIRARVLPAFDRTLSVNDAAFPYSFVPYRDNGIPQDTDTKSPGFTSWYVVVNEYVMIGNSKFSFLSPVTLANFGVAGDVRDPMQMLRRFAKDNPRWKPIMDAKLGVGKQAVDVLPKLKSSAVMNLLVFDENTRQPVDVFASKISWTSLQDLKAKLTAPRPAGQNPIDGSEWGNAFMLGDITNPLTGLLATIEGTLLGTIQTPALRFSNAPYTLQGHFQMPIDPNTQFGREVLSKRYDIFSDKTLKAISAQEIVEWVVQDASIPYELVQEALGTQFSLPPAPGRSAVFAGAGVAQQPPTQATTPNPTVGGWGAPPPAQTPAAGGWGSPQPAQTPAAGGWGSPAPAQPQASGWGASTPTQSWGSPSPAVLAAAGAVMQQPASMPVSSAVSALPPMATPAPKDEDVPYNFPQPKFWVAEGTNVTLKTKAELTALVMQGFSGGVMAENQAGGWQNAAAFGIVKPAPVAPPPAPMAPPPPPVAPVAPPPPPAPQAAFPPSIGPSTATSAAAPALPTTTAQSPASPIAQVSPTGLATPPPAPAAPGMTQDEQTKLNQYMTAAMAGQTLSPEALAEYGQLMSKFPGAIKAA
jgi:hypothetical protein